MKRKFVISTSIALVMALVMFVQPVQTLALDFLSIFRVNDVKSIKITLADLEEGMQTISNLKKSFDGKEFEHKPLINVVSKSEHEVSKLTDADDFDAFKLRLPRDLESEKPEITAVGSVSTTFTIDVDASNEVLRMLNSSKQLSDNLRNVELTMVSSDSAYAKYEELLFFATQKSYLDAPKALKDELHNVMTNLPIIPTNIRQQLAKIEQDSSDIYLPVLVGFGREVDLGANNGYIYTLADFKALNETMSKNMVAPESHNTAIDSLTGNKSHKASIDEMKQKFMSKHDEQELVAMKEAHEKAIQEMPNLENASVLIWTKDGIMYGMIGNKTDAELTKIARSVR
ncbi:hypothetical protein BHU72_09890 [Desulfuribacillus stibiiarsenatis]|uniref:DUF4367 domain-containing protein n=1 Tax=Desulfuribacillus stibiiarsenatis TaxID=1390249 RepID=A0A1E5L347_9FIRM|nr:hypothetical protein [Desulfuribacillus stibiiarsenatis]OEH84506.1 hypothetical protein BHU72_09890 [Desulfuribacillus stibiiarsenatis]